MNQQFPLYEHPSHWYKLDEAVGTTAYDSGVDATNLVNGASLAGITEGVTGYRGKNAYQFNGVGSKVVISNSVINTAAGSISFWIKPSFNTGDSTWRHFFISGGWPAVEFVFQHYSDNNYNIGWYVSSVDYRIIATHTVAPMVSGRWYHWTVTWESGGLTIAYMNGIKVADNGGPTTVASLLYSFDITQENISGLIQDFRIYDRALGDGEVRQLCNYGFHQDLQGERQPEIYFPMNEISGNIVSEGKDLLESNAISGTPDYLQSGNGGLDCINLSSSAGEYFTLTDSYWSKLSNNTFTVMAWVKPASVSTNGCTVFYLKDSSWDTIIFSLGDTATPRKMRVLLTFDNNSKNVQFLESGTPTLNVWEHVAFSFNWSTKTLKVYRNGSEIYSQQNSSVTSFMDGAIIDSYIGHVAGSALYDFDGLIQDFKVFSGVALDSTQITKEMGFNYSGTRVQRALDSMVFWNKLSSASELNDSAIGLNPAVTGTPSYAACKFADGINFTDQSVVVDIEGAYKSKTEGAIECWFKPNWPSSTPGPQPVLFDGTGASTDSFQFSFRLSQWQVYAPIDGSRVGITPAAFSAGTLMHLAVVWKDSGIDSPTDRLRVYYNGDYASFDNALGAASWDGALRIGNNSTLANYDCNGTIENVKIYSYAKTDFSDREIREPINLKDVIL